MQSRTALRNASTLRRLSLIAAVCTLLAAGAQRATAASCGDDVEGQRVACACGDFVVSDTVLAPTDPVVTEACPDDGLIVVAPGGSDGITLNLGGQSIAGSGHGTGIRVVRGGRSGALIVGGEDGDARAEVARFATGIRASGRNVVREVRSIDVHDNTTDGLSIRSSGVTLSDVRTESNGRDGASVGGHGNTVEGVSARNNLRDGLKVRGSAASVTAETSGNARNGAAIGGRGHKVEELHATGNGGAGVMATGSAHDVSGTNAKDNQGGKVAGPAGAAR